MSADVLRLTEPPTLVREQAFVRLRDAIITGYFSPGDRLIERELCEAMGVSRTSIREVLRRLEAERLVTVEPRKGPTVARVSRKQAVEIYEIRAQMEAMLFQRFAKEATDSEISGLREIYDELPSAAKAKDIGSLIAIMTRLNAYVMTVVDHDVIRDILEQLIARISFLRALSMSQPGRIESSIGEIRKIVEAVEARNAKAAARYATEYVQNAGAAALQRLDELAGKHD